METIMRLASDETAQHLFNVYFKDNLSELSHDKSANFTVQRVFERLTNSEDVSAALDLLDETVELAGIFSPPFFLILDTSKVAVITALLDACVRTNANCSEAMDVCALYHVPLMKT
jgi:hypothetical protein